MAMSNGRIVLEDAKREDEASLWLMLTFAASMGAGGESEVARAKADEYLRSYVEAWGSRIGDIGVMARSESGEVLGAAWLRLGGDGGRFKLGDSAVPELATALVPSARGRGIGTMMMKRLVAVARTRFTEIVLSVREENPAVRFYCRLGFREMARITNRVGGTSLVMKLDLGMAAPSLNAR